MQARLTTKPVEQVIAAIQALDLESVKIRAMDVELGEGWTREYADSIEFAYKNYLTMLAKYQDHAEDILLSQDVDEFWHTHILQTMKYADDCETVFGNFLHHDPQVGERSPADMERRAALAEKTRDLYEREFGTAGIAETAWAGRGVKIERAAFCNVGIKVGNAAFCNVAIEKDAAFCNVAIEKGAAFCNVAIEKGAAFCNVAIEKGAAFCNVAIEKDAAFCNVAIEKDAAFCNVAIEKDAAFCNVAIGKGAAFCNVAMEKQGVAFCNVGTRTEEAARTAA